MTPGFAQTPRTHAKAQYKGDRAIQEPQDYGGTRLNRAASSSFARKIANDPSAEMGLQLSRYAEGYSGTRAKQLPKLENEDREYSSYF